MYAVVVTHKRAYTRKGLSDRGSGEIAMGKAMPAACSVPDCPAVPMEPDHSCCMILQGHLRIRPRSLSDEARRLLVWPQRDPLPSKLANRGSRAFALR